MAQRNKRKPAKRKSNKLLKQFSTLSEGSLHSPSLSLCLELVSKIYHRHIILRDGCHESRRDLKWEDRFDIDNFLSERYDTLTAFPFLYIGGPTIFAQQRRRSKVKCPSLETINAFLVGIFKKLHLNVESSIVSLIYTERLMDKRHISITLRNWRPILIASILTASKVWDDLSSWNIEFSNLLPILSLSNINKLEGLYLQSLQYDLYISSSEYAKYYFALRGLKNTKTEHIPRYYLNTKIAKKRAPKQSLSSNNEMELNMSLSRRARNFEKKSIMNHAESIQLDEKSEQDNTESSIMEEVKDEDPSCVNMTHSMLSNNGSIISSSDSNGSNKSNFSSNLSYHVNIIEEEQELDINRSKVMMLTPHKANNNKKSTQLPSFSMPSKLQTLHPIDGKIS